MKFELNFPEQIQMLDEQMETLNEVYRFLLDSKEIQILLEVKQNTLFP